MTRSSSAILDAPTERKEKPMPKKPDVKALRTEAKEIRGRMAEIRKSRTAANADLRAAQKVVKQIDTLLAKEQKLLDRTKARIDSATQK